MDNLISSQVTLLRQRSRTMITGGESDNKIKYMTEEEGSSEKKMEGGKEEGVS